MDINHIPAATAEDILYAGWLTKRGASIKNWKKRFFCLTGETLRYYEDDTQSILKGEIGVLHLFYFIFFFYLFTYFFNFSFHY